MRACTGDPTLQHEHCHMRCGAVCCGRHYMHRPVRSATATSVLLHQSEAHCAYASLWIVPLPRLCQPHAFPCLSPPCFMFCPVPATRFGIEEAPGTQLAISAVQPEHPPTDGPNFRPKVCPSVHDAGVGALCKASRNPITDLPPTGKPACSDSRHSPCCGDATGLCLHVWAQVLCHLPGQHNTGAE